MAKKGRRRYSRGSGKEVESEMRRYKRGSARSGKGGRGGKVKSRKQAIAIGLSKARRAGVDLPPTLGASARTRAKASRDIEKGKTRGGKKR